MADFNQKSFRIKLQDDHKFISKGNSLSNSSFRVYYNDLPSSVPFIWETRPGTPKLTDSSPEFILPPLTPPPSYYPTISAKKNSKPKKIMHTLLRRLSSKKPDYGHVAPSPSFRYPMATATPTRRRSRFSSWGGEKDGRRDRIFGLENDDQKKIKVHHNHGYFSSVNVFKKFFTTMLDFDLIKDMYRVCLCLIKRN